MPASSSDYLDMDCEEAREALSALLDGEHVDVEGGKLEENLGVCLACVSWRWWRSRS
jgi:predicted anti-sigma-YlaC factor YlaD